MPKGFTNLFHTLSKTILYQQLAGKAASTIHARFMGLIKCEEFATPAAVLAVTPDQLRAVGLSNQKARYVQDLATHFQDGRLSDEIIATLDDAQLYERLTAVKGIGPWTVHMFMMFTLGRPDVFPDGDLAVVKGVCKVCKLPDKAKGPQLQEAAERWTPYRSLASWYMWRVPTDKTPKKVKAKPAAVDKAPDV
eukprot:jgi/Astpho2/124/e_gw1.00004.101.1_t